MPPSTRFVFHSVELSSKSLPLFPGTNNASSLLCYVTAHFVPLPKSSLLPSRFSLLYSWEPAPPQPPPPSSILSRPLCSQLFVLSHSFLLHHKTIPSPKSCVMRACFVRDARTRCLIPMPVIYKSFAICATHTRQWMDCCLDLRLRSDVWACLLFSTFARLENVKHARGTQD